MMTTIERERFLAKDKDGNEYTVLLIETTVHYGNRELPGSLEFLLEDGSILFDIQEGQWDIASSNVRITKI